MNATADEAPIERGVDAAIARWAAAGLDVAIIRARELTLLAYAVEHQEVVWSDGRASTARLPEFLARNAPDGNDVQMEIALVDARDLEREGFPAELVRAFVPPVEQGRRFEVLRMTSPRLELVVDTRGRGMTSVLQKHPFPMLVEGDPPHVPLPGRAVPPTRPGRSR